MAAKKKPADDAPEAPEVTEAPLDDDAVKVRLEQAKDASFIPIEELERPGDGDLCLVKVFDPSKGTSSDGPACIYDAHRGVFFKDPKFGGGGSVVGPRRDNYKAERVRNVVSFVIAVKAHDPAPEPDTIIDHAGNAERASRLPPQVRTPAATE